MAGRRGAGLGGDGDTSGSIGSSSRIFGCWQPARAAEAVSADVGAPAEPLPLPPADSYTAIPQAEPVLERFADERADYLGERREYEKGLADYRSETVR
ncbi:MAG TPA: hypothetical protein VM389_13520, partial [Phycisphaerae bacterium]|nr:hypothetical protein [Phycisphaerae bacterium]